MIANEDGTYSIIDPVTSEPYAGSAGMEKEKPYKCDTCNKRYKNLNGLKYHRAHSNPCNPDVMRNLPSVLQMGGFVGFPQLQNQGQHATNSEFMTTGY
jgi:transcription factor SFP1